jgi:tungstate transport system ATP-binding protein
MSDTLNNKPSILPLVLDGVTFEAGRLELIKSISVRFESRARSIIIGPNGAGKSLLLRLCHGLIEPSRGTVSWRGEAARHAQAMVFQRPVMLRRSVTANVEYGLKLRGVAKSDRRELIDEALERTGLRRRADAPARSLSIGEQQRLAVARAWALRPQVLFLDEPTASMDPAATYDFETVLDTIHKAGTKIIMTTHDLGQARRLADEILFLFRGRLLEHAPASEFFDQPKNDLAQAFLRGDLLWWRRRAGPKGAENKGPENSTDANLK